MTAHTLIVGLGNPFAGDDGVGPKIVEALRREPLPDGVRAEIGDSDSLRLQSIWDGEPSVWLVDAARGDGPPGSHFVLEHAELMALPQRHSTVHHLSLPESLRWLAMTWPEMAAIRYRLWGIEPEVVKPVRGLSPPVTRAIPEVVRALRSALARR